MKIISYSLWGNEEMFVFGGVENIKIAKDVYPEWKCRFYIDNSVSKKNIDRLSEYDCEIINVGNSLDDFHGMFWRFFANDDPNVDVFISRDCDSRLSFRESAAVNEWINSDKGIHCMHDHPYHWCVPMLGGMWGAKKGAIKNMSGKIERWGKYSKKGIDQEFLHQCVWNESKENCLRHDSQGFIAWGAYMDFPEHKKMNFNIRYVGDIFNEKNIPIGPLL